MAGEIIPLGRRALPWTRKSVEDLGAWHVELLCALDTVGLPQARAPKYEDFTQGGALNSRLQHLCLLCEVELDPETPAATRMHLWLRLTRIYVNAIRAFIADAAAYENHYRPRLTGQEQQFIEALSYRRPSRGPLFCELLPLAVREDLVSRTAKVLTWEHVRRLSTEPGNRPGNS